MVTILILTQMHERPLISELFCMSALRLMDAHKAKYNFLIHALVSDIDSQAVCLKYNIPFTVTCARPLGRKMNMGIESILRLYDFDYLLKIDDDDVVDNRLIDHYEPYVSRREPYFGIKQIYFLSAKEKRAVIYEYPNDTDKLFGPGKMIRRDALERTGWKQGVRMKSSMQFNASNFRDGCHYTIPAYQAKYMQAMHYAETTCQPFYALYDDEQMKGLDFISEMNFLLNGYHPIAVPSPKPLFTDVKTAVNIWSFGAYANIGKGVQPSEAMAFWSEAERQHLHNII